MLVLSFCGELVIIRAWKRGSAGTSISICLGALGLSYCAYPKRSVPGALCPEIFFAHFNTREEAWCRLELRWPLR